MKRKQFIKGINQIAQEGAIQILEEIIVGVTGMEDGHENGDKVIVGGVWMYMNATAAIRCMQRRLPWKVQELCMRDILH